MNKTVFSIILLTIIPIQLTAQDLERDVVYMKNGVIIRGMVIELLIEENAVRIIKPDRIVSIINLADVDSMIIMVDPRAVQLALKRKKRGYAAFSLGPSIPLGSFAEKDEMLAKTGLVVNFIDLGYLFSENIGVTFKWCRSNNPTRLNEVIFWTYTGLLIGPLISHKFSDNLQFDLKPMVGFATTMSPSIFAASDKSRKLAYDLGIQLRYHLNPRLSFLVASDYFHTNPSFSLLGFDQNIRTLSFSFGFCYRWR